MKDWMLNKIIAFSPVSHGIFFWDLKFGVLKFQIFPWFRDARLKGGFLVVVLASF